MSEKLYVISKIGSIRGQSPKNYMKRNWYHKSSFSDVPLEEKTQMTQTTYEASCIHEWNINGLSDHLLINVINEMLMGASA